MSTKDSECISDVSSNSSWTVIEEIEEPNKANVEGTIEPSDEIDIEVIKTTEIVTASDPQKAEDSGFVNVTFSTTSLKPQLSDDENSDGSTEGTKKDGFLTFDEYLQERLLEHDYESPNQSVFKSKLKISKSCMKKRRKCKAETIGVLSLCASLLTVTGIALLCLVFPKAIESNDFESIKSNYQALATNDSLDYNNIMGSFNKTMDVLNTVNNTELLPNCIDAFMTTTNGSKSTRELIGPLNKCRHRATKRYNSRSRRLSIFKNDMCYPKEKNDVCYPNENPKLTESSKKLPSIKTNKTKKSLKNSTSNLSLAERKNTTSLTKIQSVLNTSSLRNIIRCIIHDICLLKLINYFGKKRNASQTKRKSDKGEKKTSKLEILEAVANEVIDIEARKNKKPKITKRKLKPKKQPEQTRACVVAVHEVALKEESAPSCSKYDRIREIFPIENGKSECERRFDELDNHRRKAKEVYSKHRYNIQHIKMKYRDKMNAIGGSNIEPSTRWHMMQMVRDNYRLQLKKNREIFLKELCKMKRARAKMLRDLINQKKAIRDMRETGVGNAVLSSCQDFNARLRKMRQLESSSISMQDVQGFPIRFIRQNDQPSNSLYNKRDDFDEESSSDNLLLNTHSSQDKMEVKPSVIMKIERLPSMSSVDSSVEDDTQLNVDMKKCDLANPLQDELKSDLNPKLSSRKFYFKKDILKIDEVPPANSYPSLAEVPCSSIQGNQRFMLDKNEQIPPQREKGRPIVDAIKFLPLGRTVSEKKIQRPSPNPLFHVESLAEKAEYLKHQQQKIEQLKNKKKPLSKQDPWKANIPNIILYRY